MGFRDQVRSLRRPIQFAGEVKRFDPLRLEDIRPFFGFQRYTVCAGETGLR